MSLIAKQVRKGERERLLAPVAVPTTKPWAEVTAVITKVCTDLNAEFDAWRSGTSLAGRWWTNKTGRPDNFHLFCADGGDGSWYVSHGAPDPLRMLQARKGTTSLISPWLARARPASSTDGPTGVEVQLVKWIVEDNGKIGNVDRYTALLDALYIPLA
ncbi:MAG TPA: hypothetical protein VHC43_15045 [Mycobacteriales bacterium]|nr:hypothetical protein [Mycobacteriales bacterium]